MNKPKLNVNNDYRNINVLSNLENNELKNENSKLKKELLINDAELKKIRE